MLINNFLFYRVTKRDNLLKDFEQNCAIYLLCLKDLLRTFPLSQAELLNPTTIERSPFITLASIISLQLGKQPKFLVDESELSEESAASHGPVFIVRTKIGLFDVWVETILICGDLNENQALFLFATITDVLSLKRNQV